MNHMNIQSAKLPKHINIYLGKKKSNLQKRDKKKDVVGLTKKKDARLETKT